MLQTRMTSRHPESQVGLRFYHNNGSQWDPKFGLPCPGCEEEDGTTWNRNVLKSESSMCILTRVLAHSGGPSLGAGRAGFAGSVEAVLADGTPAMQKLAGLTDISSSIQVSSCGFAGGAGAGLGPADWAAANSSCGSLGWGRGLRAIRWRGHGLAGRRGS